MGVIIKYLISFPDAKFKISNDLLAGDYVIDADVTVDMKRGAAGSTFEIKLYDLPEKQSRQLSSLAKDPKTSHVNISLGYMDGPFKSVLTGTYTSASPKIDKESLTTTIKGVDNCTFALEHKQKAKDNPGTISLKDALQKLMTESFTGSSVDASAQTSVTSLLGLGDDASGDVNQVLNWQADEPQVQDLVLRGQSLMTILEQLTRKHEMEFFVSDNTVHVGTPITDDSYTPAEFTRGINLATFQEFTKQVTKVKPKPGTATDDGDKNQFKVEAYKFTIAGDPGLRPAQAVFAGVDKFRKKDSPDYRVHSVSHILTMAGGYSCDGVAMKTCHDTNCRRQQDALGQDNPDALIQGIAQQIKDAPRQQALIEVGAIKSFNNGQADDSPIQATLYFGQDFEADETQPSIRTEVSVNEKQLLRNKPVVSPFAWHKSGLVTPIYPGMKALLAHNLGLADDTLVLGFVWSQTPPLEPPKSLDGDWWLCLPTSVDATKGITDKTMAANDLIDGTGRRVIEVSGLRVTINSEGTKAAGQRPADGTNDEFLIEHKSGAKIQIDSDGNLTLKGTKISIEGDVTIKGNVDIQ